jgi:hypothetical protein
VALLLLPPKPDTQDEEEKVIDLDDVAVRRVVGDRTR